MEVTDVRLETVTGRLLDDQDNPLEEDGQPVYICVRKLEILCSTERTNMMSWWELREQADVPVHDAQKIFNRILNQQIGRVEVYHF
jgi:hypothetical protein